MNKHELTALAERVEAAEGPSRELDAEIVCAVGLAQMRDGFLFKMHPQAGSTYELMHRPPAYTASIDSALTLVPEGWTRLLDNTDGKEIVELFKDGEYIPRGSHPTSLALALVAAALRSQAQGEGK